MQDPPPEEPEDDANMTFADLLEETANGVSSKIPYGEYPENS